MQSIITTIAVTLSLAGAWMIYVSSMRVKTAREMQARMLKIADLFWQDASRLKKDTDPEATYLYNCIVISASFAPALAAGTVSLKAPALDTSASQKTIQDFLSENAWALSHLWTVSLILRRLIFHATPWRPLCAAQAAAAYLCMHLFASDRGTVTKGPDYKETARETAGIVNLRMRMPRDPFAAAH